MAVSKREQFARGAEAAYRSAYNVFQLQATAAGISLYPLRANQECFEVSKPPRKTTVEVLGALRIEQLPRRHVQNPQPNAQGNLGVLVSSKEIYHLPRGRGKPASMLGESYVSLSYYRPRNPQWETLLSLRYDYGQRGARDAHPIFHIQHANGMPGNELAQLNGVPAIKPLQSLDTVRMPSANMVGPTAFLKIAADHFPHANFRAVLQNLQTLPFFQSWECDCKTLDDTKSARGLIATGWYGSN